MQPRIWRRRQKKPESSSPLPGAGSLESRREGFLEQVKAKYPGLTVVADKYADGQATTGPDSIYLITLKKQPGDRVSVQYVRDGKKATTSVTLSARP